MWDVDDTDIDPDKLALVRSGEGAITILVTRDEARQLAEAILAKLT